MNENCWAGASLPNKPVVDRSIDCGEVVKTSGEWGQFEPEYQTLAGLTHPWVSAWINTLATVVSATTYRAKDI
jgi:hypothetical protein